MVDNMTGKDLVKQADNMLKTVPDTCSFHVSDGSTLCSLNDLYTSLKDMGDETFSHHVTDDKNDFGNWVKDVFKDYTLANNLFSAKNRSECLNRVGERIYECEKSVASPGSVLLTPAPPPTQKTAPKKFYPKPAVTKKKRSRLDVDPDELEKTINEINRRYWEKKKAEKEKIEVDSRRSSREKKTTPTIPETWSAEKTDELISTAQEEGSSVEDLLDITEKESFGKTLIGDLKKVFSISGFKSSASELKSAMRRDKVEVGETKDVLKDISRHDTDKAEMISELKAAHMSGGTR